MKKKLYFKTAFITLATTALLSSCLKDNAHYVDFAAAKPLVELPAATGIGPQGGTVVGLALDILTTPQEVDVAVNLAAPKPLSSPLTVKLSVDAAALDAYNTATQTKYTADSTSDVAAGVAVRSKPTIYTLLPANFYTAVLTVTIPGGKNLANAVIMVNTSLFDFSKAYVLPLTITDGGGQQISNYKTVFYNIQGKNKYDGTYKVNGYALRLGDNVLTGNFQGVSEKVSTLSSNAVQYTALWGDGAGAIGGINPVTITVDPTTNKVTMSSSTNATLANAVGYNNRYDPATKTFYVSFAWNAPGTRAATDTLVYTGPR